MNFTLKRTLCGCATVTALLLLVALAWPRVASTDDSKPAATKDKAAEKKQPVSKAQAELRAFMRGKLSAANQVLEGLVTEDFALVSKGTAQLKEISESAKWRVSNDAMYRQYSNEYQRKVAQLEKAAGEKKADAVALAYIDVTMSCVECHKWARATLVADLDFSKLNRRSQGTKKP